MEDKRGVVLKAGAAFGSGAHETTQLSLAALELLSGEGYTPESVLDVGAGSGILSLAAAHYWPEARILAADISPEAVAVATENFASNGISVRARAVRADGYDKSDITQGSPYDLILCNILAEPIIRMAPGLKAHLAPGGCAVLSGILVWLLEPVLEAHRVLELEAHHMLGLSDWRAVVVSANA